MGHQIAFQCAGHGVDVVLYDIDVVALDCAPGRIATYAQGLIADGVITADVRDEAMTRITMTTAPDDLRDQYLDPAPLSVRGGHRTARSRHRAALSHPGVGRQPRRRDAPHGNRSRGH
jgi:hypothetical protein